jgi:hypothetical protein
VGGAVVGCCSVVGEGVDGDACSVDIKDSI